ncbi:hypothetical protein KIL84_008343, partial [Mauremys mutica]
IALMEKKKELLIIDSLCDEIRYERTCLRNWRGGKKGKQSSFMQSANVPYSSFHNAIFIFKKAWRTTAYTATVSTVKEKMRIAQ